ncbi:MAG: transposase [Deltaproteobacteria bacterium]|jgi:transposase|nr:transposase [Deltaproteobacteria bacterium]
MSSLTYHKHPNGATYVYRQDSYWDKVKKYPSSRQVCLGKLGAGGEIIYNKRFRSPEAREALERGEMVTTTESLLIGQSLVLAQVTKDTGLERVLRRSFEAEDVDALLSLAWAVASGSQEMYMASIWMEDHDCPAHKDPPSSQDISRILASISQSQIEDFLRDWTHHRSKGLREQYCYDLTSVSSCNMSNPFVEWGHNRDKEHLAQINIALLTGVTSRIPTYYEIHPGSMSDTKTIASFIARMKKYGMERIRILLDRGFYSAKNINLLLEDRIGFYIPVPTTVGWQRELIDTYRDAVEMPEYVIPSSGEGRQSELLYGMTVLDKIDGRRVWKHLYYDGERRIWHIRSLFESLRRWEEELLSGDTKEKNKWAYERYFTVKTTPKRGLQVTRKQEAINAYKTDRAGYWAMLTSCEKNAITALEAYRERALVESHFDDMKNELSMDRIRTHGSHTMRGRTFVQFLALILTARIRVVMARAWEDRMDVPKEDRLSRLYSLKELMARLGSYRKTRFSDRYGSVVSASTKAQHSIFRAFGITVG